MSTILLTGATGYIGGRLLQHLEEHGRPVRCLARNPAYVRLTRATTSLFRGDCLDEASLAPAFEGVDVAFYLVHSMAAGTGIVSGVPTTPGTYDVVVTVRSRSDPLALSPRSVSVELPSALTTVCRVSVVS